MSSFSWKLAFRTRNRTTVPARRRSTAVRIGVTILEFRCTPAGLQGLNFAPFIGANEDPRNGPGQMTIQERQQRLAVVTPHANTLRTFSAGGDLLHVGADIHALGKQAAIEAFIGKNLLDNQAEIDAVVAAGLAGEADEILVGSEVRLRGDVSEAVQIDYINQVKNRLAAGGKSIPVSTADTWNTLVAHPSVGFASTKIEANIYPYFEGISIDRAMYQVDRHYEQLKATFPNQQIVVAETGWPSAGPTIGDAVASPENAANYLQAFVSWAEAKDVDYFYFSSTDEPWKRGVEGEQGAHWGIAFTDQKLKPGVQRTLDGERSADSWSYGCV